MKIKNISEILFLPTLLAIGIVAGISGYIPVFFTDGNLPTCLLGLLVFQAYAILLQKMVADLELISYYYNCDI